MEKTVDNQRPINLDMRSILSIKLPITSYASILHRVSGVIVLVGMILMLYICAVSLESPAGFLKAKAMLANPLVKLITWGLLSSLLYHIVAGTRHLLMDLGYCESLEGGKLSSKIVLIIGVILVISAGVWLI